MAISKDYKIINMISNTIGKRRNNPITPARGNNNVLFR